MNGDKSSYEILTEKLHYDPKTGIFTNIKTGEKAGYVRDRNGYKTIYISVPKSIAGYYKVGAHRLAWLYMTGEFPKFPIDHINRDGTDNRWKNLRNGKELNNRNLSLSKKNQSGVSGVSWDKQKSKWRAVGHYTDDTGRHRQKFLGYFDDVGSASLKVKEFRGENNYEPGHGRPRPAANVAVL